MSKGDESSPPEVHTVPIRINWDGLLAALDRVLRDSIGYAAFGLIAARQAEVEALELPDTFPKLQFGPAMEEAEANRRFPGWLIGTLLRDCIEALDPVLSDARRVARVSRLASGLTVKEFNEHLRADVRFRDRATLGRKINQLQQEFPNLISETWSKALYGLVQLRNCLTHGQGIVRARDLTTAKRLVVSRLAVEVWLTDEAGQQTRVSGPGFLVEKDSHLGLKRRWRRRLFKVGDRPHFTPQEFAELAWTLHFFVLDLRQALESHLRDQGVLPTEKKS